jgi:hypothetical protein
VENKLSTINYLQTIVRENRRGNHEWTIQRHWQHWGQDTNQRQTKQLNTTQKIKNISNMDTTTKQ